MDYYGVWVSNRDQRNEALQNAECQRLVKQALAQSETSFRPPFSRIISHAALIVPIILALLGKR